MAGQPAVREAVRRERDAAPGRSSLASGLFGVAMLGAMLASAALSLQRLVGLALPGCGADSPCGQAAASAWGSVPALGWPISHVGVAYFGALFAAWAAARGAPPTRLRWPLRAGVALSLMYTIVMFTNGYVCGYCLTVHAANLVGWLAAERAARSAPVATRQSAGTLLAAFAGLTGMLLVSEFATRHRTAHQAELALAESTRRLAASSAPTAEAEAVSVSGATDAASAPAGLIGRWTRGPEIAPVRIVAFFSYQCEQCRAIDAQIDAVLRDRSDVAVTVKHFPMGKDCNPTLVSDPQPNACWAARASEAAGILGGSEAFWRMHDWLFARQGAFDGPALRTGIESLGFSAAEFQRVMQSDETLTRVRADIDDGLAVGLWQTPMIFVNGEELRGWNAPNAIRRAVDAALASNPQPQSFRDDRPPLAIEKLVQDWREEPLRTIEIDPSDRTLGPAAAPVTVVMYGDYRQPASAELFALLKKAAGDRADTRVIYRQFPFNQACNPGVARTLYEDACLAAGAAVAAGLEAGPDGFWKMHAWLMTHRDGVDDTALAAAAEACGLEAGRLRDAARSDAVLASIRQQAQSGARLGVSSIPTVYVNGRRVPRWKHRDLPVVLHVIEQAAAGDAPPDRP